MNETSVITPRPQLSAIDWPKPAEPASRTTLAAMGIAGIAGVIALPDTAAGVGYLIVAVVCAVATFVMIGRVRLVPLLWSVLSLALVAITVFRDAQWLFFLCVLGALVAASLAITDGKSVGGVIVGSCSVAVSSIRALPWVVRGLRVRRQKVSGKAVRIVQAVVLSGFVVVIFVPLLAGADAAFASLLGRLTPEVNGDKIVELVFYFLVVAIGVGGLGYTVASQPRFVAGERRPSDRSRVEWVLPVGVLVLVFAAFAAVQFAVLFGGAQYVLRTSDMTFAEYARSGFWQLLTVTLLTLVVLAAAIRWAPRETVADRAWLRGLLGALCVLTLVIVASALNRMWTYQEAYGFTIDRLLVEAMELWLGVVYLLVMAAGIRLEAQWLPRAMAGSALAGLFVFACLNPDRLIAERNVASWEQTRKIDTDYLRLLSADAAPALMRLPASMRGCVMQDLPERLADTSWQSWNLSRENVRHLAPELRERCWENY